MPFIPCAGRHTNSQQHPFIALTPWEGVTCRIQSLICFSSTCVIHTWWDGGPGLTFPFSILISAQGSIRTHHEALSSIIPHPSRPFPYWTDVSPVADPFLHYLSKAPQSLTFLFLPSDPPFLSQENMPVSYSHKGYSFSSQFFFFLSSCIHYFNLFLPTLNLLVHLMLFPHLHTLGVDTWTCFWDQAIY